MKTTEITVHYERKFSDNNYGSEGMSASMTASFDSDPGDDAIDVLAARLRVFVLVELSRSAAPAVARAANYELNPPPPRMPASVGAERADDMPF